MEEQAELFPAPGPGDAPLVVAIGSGARILRGRALPVADALVAAVHAIARVAPFRHMRTPGGHPMSAAMTNCGAFGWVTEPSGYRYAASDPASGRPWPAMPPLFRDLAVSAADAAGYPGFMPDSCLMNRYRPGAKLSLHQDRDEGDLAQPIVSVSLGLAAILQFGGPTRRDKIGRHPLFHGDIVVFGGASRLAFHGIPPLAGGDHPATGPWRFNLSFRRAG